MSPERKAEHRRYSQSLHPASKTREALAEALDALDAAERESEHRISMLQLVLDLPSAADWKTIVERVASARTAEVSK